jgi:hypothetical protein
MLSNSYCNGSLTRACRETGVQVQTSSKRPHPSTSTPRPCPTSRRTLRPRTTHPSPGQRQLPYPTHHAPHPNHPTAPQLHPIPRPCDSVQRTRTSTTDRSLVPLDPKSLHHSSITTLNTSPRLQKEAASRSEAATRRTGRFPSSSDQDHKLESHLSIYLSI